MSDRDVGSTADGQQLKPTEALHLEMLTVESVDGDALTDDSAYSVLAESYRTLTRVVREEAVA